jgi:hypothetical protein
MSTSDCWGRATGRHSPRQTSGHRCPPHRYRGTRPNQISTVCSCATTGFANNQPRREPGDFYRFPFVGAEYSITHIRAMMKPAFGRVSMADLPFRCQAGRSTSRRTRLLRRTMLRPPSTFRPRGRKRILSTLWLSLLCHNSSGRRATSANAPSVSQRNPGCPALVVTPT